MIDQLAKELFSNLQAQGESLKGVKDFTEQQARKVAEKALKELNFVSREEFDIQQAILERSREKIDKLEQQIEALEKVLSEK